MNAMSQADVVCTGRVKSIFHALVTHIALSGNAICGIKGNSVIGAGIHTQLASAAYLLIQDHDPIISF